MESARSSMRKKWDFQEVRLYYIHTLEAGYEIVNVAEVIRQW